MVNHIDFEYIFPRYIQSHSRYAETKFWNTGMKWKKKTSPYKVM